jgi:hypothetical protein
MCLISVLILSACTKQEDVEKYAKKEQWDSYEIHGYCWFGCADKDFWATSFTARKGGIEFEGCVCSGLFFKSTTLRLD